MKLLLIKAGKAVNTIKRDGLIRGGKRVGSAFFAMFGRVGSGDILFITGGVGDSALYRAHHQAEELSLHGFKCSITVQDNPLLVRYADKFKIFIFHRVLFTSSVQKFVERIKKQDKEIIFETDDLVYDPKYLKYMDYHKQMNPLERKLYENGVGGEILRDPYVKACTTTTSFLAEKLRAYGKKVFISANKLSNRDLMAVEKIKKASLRFPTQSISGHLQSNAGRKSNAVIGYFSGTISHNKDFAVAEDALIYILEKYPQTKLFLAGPLDISSEFDKFQDRIERVSYVPRDKHFENISMVDISIVPLEVGNPFCESKSELKFFEAGILKVPTVASATRTFREAVSDGVDGFTATDISEWKEKLERLVSDDGLRKRMGEKAYEKSLKDYTNKNSRDSGYYEYLRSKLASNV